MKKDVAVEVKDLTTGYGGRKGNIVLDSVNGTLRRGELTSLLGPNGAGKSTLLKTLSGFIPAISGDVLVGGINLHEYKNNELARRIGVVLTERQAPENMTVRQLVELGRSPYTGFWGRLGEADEEIVEDALQKVGIGQLASRMVDSLSDGERQKVMIAKALAQQTDIIFLDEPTAFLDYPSKVEIMLLLHRLSRDNGKSVFMSTHDLELALQISDRVWLVDKKKGLSTGTPEDLAIDGTLGKYFEKNNVVFDPLSGLFRLSLPVVSKVSVKGDERICRIMEKGLSRYGIGLAEQGDIADYSIEVAENLYIIKKGDECIGECVSLGNLFEILTDKI